MHFAECAPLFPHSRQIDLTSVGFIPTFLRAYPRAANSYEAVGSTTSRVTALPCVSIDVLIKKIVRVKPRIYGFAGATVAGRATRQKRDRGKGFVRLRIGLKSMWHLSAGSRLFTCTALLCSFFLFERRAYLTSGGRERGGGSRDP